MIGLFVLHISAAQLRHDINQFCFHIFWIGLTLFIINLIIDLL
jgi:hypothetical protein